MNRVRLVSIVACLAVCYLLCGSGTLLSGNPSAKKKAGRIKGVVVNVNNARVARAKVRVRGWEFRWEGETDDAGEFTMAAPAGEYRIYVVAPGFRKFESAFLRVKPGVTEMVNLQLEVASVNGLTPAKKKKKR